MCRAKWHHDAAWLRRRAAGVHSSTSAHGPKCVDGGGDVGLVGLRGQSWPPSSQQQLEAVGRSRRGQRPSGASGHKRCRRGGPRRRARGRRCRAAQPGAWNLRIERHVVGVVAEEVELPLLGAGAAPSAPSPGGKIRLGRQTGRQPQRVHKRPPQRRRQAASSGSRWRNMNDDAGKPCSCRARVSVRDAHTVRGDVVHVRRRNGHAARGLDVIEIACRHIVHSLLLLLLASAAVCPVCLGEATSPAALYTWLNALREAAAAVLYHSLHDSK